MAENYVVIEGAERERLGKGGRVISSYHKGRLGIFSTDLFQFMSELKGGAPALDQELCSGPKLRIPGNYTLQAGGVPIVFYSRSLVKDLAGAGDGFFVALFDGGEFRVVEREEARTMTDDLSFRYLSVFGWLMAGRFKDLPVEFAARYIPEDIVSLVKNSS